MVVQSSVRALLRRHLGRGAWWGSVGGRRHLSFGTQLQPDRIARSTTIISSVTPKRLFGVLVLAVLGCVVAQS